MTRIARAGALLALALLTALAFAGPATAKKKPPKPGKGAQSARTLPKHWAEQHKVRGAKADPDGDGLSNWGELRSHTKPKKADSDRDGTGDAREEYDRDGLDNGSEEAAGTDPGRKDTDRDGRKDGAEDADKDGLDNAAEDRTGNDPRNADTDGDGVKDGKENAGVVKAFDGENLTIALAAGGLLTAVVDAGTEVTCDDEAAYEEAHESGHGSDDADNDEYEYEDEFGDDDADLDEELTDEEWELLEQEEDARQPFVKAFLAEEGDEDDPDDEEWEEDREDTAEGDDCAGLFLPGTPVHEAVLDGAYFATVELVVDGE